jgi:hypothetical protein
MTSLHTSQKAVTFRNPSNANLMLSSRDRTDGSTAGNFTISQQNSLLNGFFTGITVSEVVLDWNLPNVYDISGAYLNIGSGFVYNSIVSVDISGSLNNLITIPIGAYSVANLLDTIVARVNAAGIGTTLSVVQAGNAITLSGTTAYRFSPANYNRVMFTQLGFPISNTFSTAGVTKTIFNSRSANTSSQGGNLFQILNSGTPNLQQIQYLDFVSSQLTNCQRLKDTTTATTERNVINRWYLTPGNFVPMANDIYGFVVYPQYQAFSERRQFNPAKQIRWEPNIPIGQLKFEVWATDLDGNVFLLNTQGFEWNMTLQVSED